jgi:MoaA/NifB/PqqE/SkfB family radical SAM enzyme
MCPRNLNGYPYNDGYVEHDLTLAEAQKIFSFDFLQQLTHIQINGNFGDAVMNPETVEIVEYFRNQNSDLKITISTNAGARDSKFWTELARLGVEIYFCIDGFEDTHHLYRQNTLYSTVIRNAKIFIDAGGKAIWKMIKFEHNQHQIPRAQQLSQEMGFKRIEFTRMINGGRDPVAVFNKDKQITHLIGSPKITDFEQVLKTKTHGATLDYFTTGVKIKPIGCQVQKTKSVYISSTGNVYPCCWTGFNPPEYGKENYFGALNKQLNKLIYKNNAVTYSFEQCIEWFNSVEESWKIPTFDQGRLLVCHDNCGVNNSL